MRRNFDHVAEPEHRRVAYEFMGAMLVLGAYLDEALVTVEDAAKATLTVRDHAIRKVGARADAQRLSVVCNIIDAEDRKTAEQTVVRVTVRGEDKQAVRDALQTVVKSSDHEYGVVPEEYGVRLQPIREVNAVGRSVEYWQAEQTFCFR